MTLCKFPLVSNPISLQSHTCVYLGCILLGSEGVFIICCEGLLFSGLLRESSTFSIYLLVCIMFDMLMRIISESLAYLLLMSLYIKHICWNIKHSSLGSIVLHYCVQGLEILLYLSWMLIFVPSYFGSSSFKGLLNL